jgi:hypothetical protein
MRYESLKNDKIYDILWLLIIFYPLMVMIEIELFKCQIIIMASPTLTATISHPIIYNYIGVREFWIARAVV